MLKLNPLKLTVGAGVSALALLFIWFVLKWIYETFWLKKQALLQTNLAFEKTEYLENHNAHLKKVLTKRILKVRRYKHRLEILKFNPNLNSETILREIPTLERIFKRKIVAVDFKNYGIFNHKEKLVIHFENFPKVLTAKDFTDHLPLGSYWLGQNSRGSNLVQDRRLPFLFIGGGMGSGKSIALASYVISLLSSFTANGKPQPRLVLVSGDKMSEFVPMIKRLQKSGEVLTFNANQLQEVLALNILIEGHLKKCGEFFQLIKSEGLVVRHWFDIEHEKKPEPILFVFDEAPEYFGELHKIRITKESTPEEVEAHEVNQQKIRLGFLTDRIFKTLRETGIFVIVSSQTALASDLQALSFQNLKQNFLLGRGITPQVMSLWGLTELSQSQLEQGCFYSFNGREQTILKAPFLTMEDTP